MGIKEGTGWRIVLITDRAGQVLEQLRDVCRSKGHELTGVFTSPPPKSLSGLKGHLEAVDAAGSLGIPAVVSRKKAQWPGLLRALEPDLAISCMFMWKVPKEVYSIPRLGTFNVHIGQLPQYRGPNSVGWAFRNDEGELGVTAHWMAPDWDTGPVLARGFLPYGDDDDVTSLMPGLIRIALDVIDEALEGVSAGHPGEPQDESLAMYCPLFEPEWREIDWNTPAREIHNKVRSCFGNRDQPRGALGTVDGEQVVVLTTQLTSGVDADGFKPGTVITHDDNGIVIQCGDGPLRILKWEEA